MAEILYKELSYIVVGCIFDIRKQYGPGQKEIIYQRILIEKIVNKGLKVEKEKKISILSQDTGIKMGTYQPDLVVNDKIIIELKSSKFSGQNDERQLYYYLRNSKYELGILVNFSTPELYLKRIVYSNNKKPLLTALNAF